MSDECGACGSTNIETVGLTYTRTRRGTVKTRIRQRCKDCELAWNIPYREGLLGADERPLILNLKKTQRGKVEE